MVTDYLKFSSKRGGNLHQIEISEYSDGQEEIIVQIHNQAFQPWIENLGSLYSYRYIESNDVKEWYNEKNSKILIAYFNGEPVAYIHFKIEIITGLSNFTQMVVIETEESLGQSKLAVLPRFQNKNIGTELVNFATNYFPDIDTILILAYNDNEAMNRIMEKLDFEHKKLLFYKKYSDKKPYANDSVLATIDLREDLPNIKLNSEVTVRSIETKDYQKMREIYGSTRPDVFGENPTIENIYEWIESGWGEMTLIAEIKDEVVGCMEFSKEGVIGIPGVLPEYQKKGIGSTLFYHLLKTMKDLGYSKALADTGYQLEEAIKMYKRFNFDLSQELWSWIKIVK